MKGLFWTMVVLAGLAWTGLAWLFHAIAGAGGAAVVRVTRWLDLEPAGTQWIADAFSVAGGIAQWLVVLVWLIGAGALGLLAWLGSQAMNGAAPAMHRGRGQAGHDKARVIDGEVRDRTLS